MRLTIDFMQGWLVTGMLLIGISLGACKKANPNGEIRHGNPSFFTPYVVLDSSKIVTYPEGLELYVVKSGWGDYPQNGDNILLHYQGMLQDGSVFDDSYRRGEPLEFKMGSGRIIPGMESGLKKIRYGTQAILTIPPRLGYGGGKGNGKSPINIPPDATLTFHIHLVGNF
jgi:FKBP-type peptidyl-prolyl cis-trans isomerase